MMRSWSCSVFAVASVSGGEWVGSEHQTVKHLMSVSALWSVHPPFHTLHTQTHTHKGFSTHYNTANEIRSPCTIGALPLHSRLLNLFHLSAFIF